MCLSYPYPTIPSPQNRPVVFVKKSEALGENLFFAAPGNEVALEVAKKRRNVAVHSDRVHRAIGQRGDDIADVATRAFGEDADPRDAAFFGSDLGKGQLARVVNCGVESVSVEEAIGFVGVHRVRHAFILPPLLA